ncbi:dimethylsulfonioproprionate lyase family protein [Labrys sp. KB_33_2]|uniref:dimethylsulfonioproprionate lyase family protein n=1 Tax=Labrys sp. KB_33_2 TaxID=3237479 RepID=UPI003F8DD3A2
MLDFADGLDSPHHPVASSHASRLRVLAQSLTAVREIPSARVPIQPACEAELAANGDPSPLASALLDLLPIVHVTRSPSYLAAPPSPSFADNYGYAVICGPQNGPPTLLTDSQLAFGLMFLGPQTHYPLHHHPADEVYYPLTGPSFWQAGTSSWVSRQAGEIIHHPPWLPHATLSADRPLVLLYVWAGDLLTDAAFLPASTTQGNEAP